MCMSILHVYMFVDHMHAWWLQRSKEGRKSPETGDTDSFELSCWCWVPNLGPLEEKPMFLTAESILQP